MVCVFSDVLSALNFTFLFVFFFVFFPFLFAVGIFFSIFGLWFFGSGLFIFFCFERVVLIVHVCLFLFCLGTSV